MMADLATLIQNRRLEPGVTARITGCPDHRADALAPQIKRDTFALREERIARLGLGGRCVKTLVDDMSVDPVQAAHHALVGRESGRLPRPL